MEREHPAYAWEFIQEMAEYARYVAVGVALIGGAITRDVRFALTCAGAAIIDIWLFQRAGKRAQEDSKKADGAVAYGIVAGLVAGRMALKAVLLIAAALVPSVLSFWGMVAGVLVMDTTVLLVGGIVASVRTFRFRSAG